MLNLLLNINSFELFDISLIDTPSLMSLLVRFLFNFIVVVIIVKYLYLPNSKKVHFVFPYLLISTAIFLLIFMLGAVKIKIGIALGLFAIFGIIRYRTNPIPIKEMTYLFTIIAISVINGMVSNKISYIEIFVTNIIVLGVIALVEKVWFKNRVSTKRIRFERIDIITPEHRVELTEILEKRLGVIIKDLEVGDVDYLTDTTKIKIYFHEK